MQEIEGEERVFVVAGSSRQPLSCRIKGLVDGYD